MMPWGLVRARRIIPNKNTAKDRNRTSSSAAPGAPQQKITVGRMERRARSAASRGPEPCRCGAGSRTVAFFGFRADIRTMERSADLMSTGEAARLLGCSRQHVVDLCARGVLPFVSVGSHRRLRRADVTGLTSRELSRDQERSLWLHQVVAGRLALDPYAVLSQARRNLQHLRSVHPSGMTAQWLTEWQKVLDSGEDAVFAALTSRSTHAVELRQNSPFAGVLSAEERTAALEAFRNHWRQAHAA